jgi:hypothetical protein
VTHQTAASKAQTATIAIAMARICNAAGGCLVRSPAGPGCHGPQRVVARSLCAHSTRPRARLALWPVAARREPSDSVNRP